jgi:general secretion pathway protein D
VDGVVETTAAETPAPSIYLGTGVFVDAGALSAGNTTQPAAGDVTLNFADTDVREVVRAILGGILEVNYIIDPQVSGTITVQTSRPLARSALLTTLESILRANGAAMVPESGGYRIVPLASALSGLAPLGLDARQPGFGVHVVPLRYIAAREMAKIIGMLASERNVISTDVARNLVILAGSQSERATMLETVELFDVDWLAGMSFGLFPLQNTDAETLVQELDSILGVDGEVPLSGLLRFVPIERLNAVMVISPRADYLERAQGWITRLDLGIDVVGQRLYVYYVENGRAADLADVLNDVFDQRRPAVEDVRLAPGLDRATLYAEGTARVARELQAQDARLTGAVEGEAAAPAPPREPAGAARAGEAGAGIALAAGSDIRIIADEANNALVILATAEEYRMIEAALDKLDVVPLQVMIEATIAEVTLTDDLEYGVQWFFENGNSSFNLNETLPVRGFPGFAGFSYLFSTADARITLNAIASVTDLNIISSPSLMVLDNQTAEIQVGDQVPVASQSAVSVSDPDAPIVNSIEYFDTGVILRVTPRVNAGGLVIMELEQEVSDVVATITSGIDSPTINQRRIKTTVAIQSGETVALGGLIRDDQESSNSGIPLLREIPVLGKLFSTTTEGATRTELIVLITPRVVSNQQEARQVTEELRRRIRAVAPLDEKLY